MLTNTLGLSSRPISQIGLGLAALGRPGYITIDHGVDLLHSYAIETMEANTHAVLDAAWQAGIRYFDAARSYGRAEEFLASWLTVRNPEPTSITVGSKWGYTYVADWNVQLPAGQKHEVKDHSLSVLNHQINESNTLLGERLNLYQIHSATIESGVLENEVVLNRLSALREAGVLIGLSTSGPNQAATIYKALNVLRDGAPLFDSVQATWNLLEQSATPALQAAADAGISVIIKEAVANGRLTARNVEPVFHMKRQTLGKAIGDQTTSLDALSIAAAINQSWSTTVLSGAVSVAQLQSNLRALDIAWNDEATAHIADWVEAPKIYWYKRSQMPWN